MKLTRKTFAVQAEQTADEGVVRVICSTEDTDRAGEVVVQSGIDLDAYKRNPVVLFQHDPNQPVARATDIAIEDGRLVATVLFPPAGISAKADEVRGLVKAGILSGVSIGMEPVDTEPMDPNDTRRNAPVRYLKSNLLEFSFVSIPANPAALVVARSANRRGAAVVKSLWDCGRLADLLCQLGWIWDSAAFEREIEDDASRIPEVLGQIMQDMGQALLDMTAEEVAELLATTAPEETTEKALTPAERFGAGWRARPPVTKAHAASRTAIQRRARALALG